MNTLLRKFFIACVLLAVTALLGYITGYTARNREIDDSTEPETHTNIIERDTTVYNFITKDSTIIDWHAKPIEHFHFDTIHDSIWIIVPIYHYHFSNELADAWVSGYDVTLDSLCGHVKEVYHYTTTTIKEPMYRNFIGADVGFYDASVLYMRSFGRVSVGLSAGYTYDKTATARGIIGWNF